MISDPMAYADILDQLKLEIRTTLAVNTELLNLYWSVGSIILIQQQKQGWGAKVIEALSRDIRKEFPDLKGFSFRNMLDLR
jgi:hypothetical protein